MANVNKTAFQISTPLSTKLRVDNVNPSPAQPQRSGSTTHLQSGSPTADRGEVLARLIERIKSI